MGQEEVQLTTGHLLELEQKRSLWMAMQWQNVVASDIDYARSLRLYPAEKDGDWAFILDTSLWKPSALSTESGTPPDLIDALVHLEFPLELPAGDYELRLIVYNAENLHALAQVGVREPELVLARVRWR